jgi:hypothetical protein
MTNKQDELFLQYWANQRLGKKKRVYQISAGLPAGVAMVVGIFANLLSGWYSRAQMEFFRSNSSLIFILLVSSLLIVGFSIYTTAMHRWDMNEKRYLELLNKNQKQNHA